MWVLRAELAREAIATARARREDERGDIAGGEWCVGKFGELRRVEVAAAETLPQRERHPTT